MCCCCACHLQFGNSTCLGYLHPRRNWCPPLEWNHSSCSCLRGKWKCQLDSNCYHSCKSAAMCSCVVWLLSKRPKFLALFTCLMSRTVSAKEQCFSLTTNQRTVLSAMAFQWSEQGHSLTAKWGSEMLLGELVPELEFLLLSVFQSSELSTCCRCHTC